jgi:deoxyribonuclease-4
MTFYFGSHINVSQGLIQSAKDIYKAEGNLLQIFYDDAKHFNKSDINKFKQYLQSNHMKVVVHASYKFNLAREWDKYSHWINHLIDEIEFSYNIGAFGIVLHFGKKLNLSLEEAYNNMFTSLIHVHRHTIKYKKVKLLLETSTGQGTELCYRIDDLAYFFRKFKIFSSDLRDRFRICIDSCHIFSAGYCLKNKNHIKLFLETFDELIGLRYVSLIHLNDCKVDCGMQIDRHANIGKGYIGYNGLKYFFDYFRKLNIPIVLETPNEGYKYEIRYLTK